MKTETGDVVGALFGLAVGVTLAAWGVYAFCCTMNHFGVWPFSYIGAG